MLSALVTGTLDAGLALLVVVAMVVVVLAAWAAVVVREAASVSLALRAAIAMPGACRAGRAERGRPAGDDARAVHQDSVSGAAAAALRREGAGGTDCHGLVTDSDGKAGEERRPAGLYELLAAAGD